MQRWTLSLLGLLTVVPAFAAIRSYQFQSGSSDLPVATISQRGRLFSMSSVTLTAGQRLRIVNDDADLQHHAYVDSNTFKFDSGDQEPGSQTDITFPVTGVFTVQCGIHPKMKMVVTVK